MLRSANPAQVEQLDRSRIAQARMHHPSSGGQPLGERPTRASHRLLTVASMRPSTSGPPCAAAAPPGMAATVPAG
jgi:hypothetical protein